MSAVYPIPGPEHPPLLPGEGADGGAQGPVGGGPRVAADQHGSHSGQENRFGGAATCTARLAGTQCVCAPCLEIKHF